MHGFVKTSTVYVSVFFAFTIVFFITFRTPLFAGEAVLFYRGIELLATTFILGAIAATTYFRFVSMERIESIAAALIAASAIHLTLFVVFPVTFDRSVTMYLLNELADAPSESVCRGYAPLELENHFINEYVQANDAIERRITEQGAINMVTLNDQCVAISEQGRGFLRFSQVVGRLYDLTI